MILGLGLRIPFCVRVEVEQSITIIFQIGLAAYYMKIR